MSRSPQVRCRRLVAGAITAALLVVIASCATRTTFPLPGGGGAADPSSVDVERLRARLDRDGDGSFDSPLPVGPFPFSHARRIGPFLEAAGVEALHAALTFDTGTEVVIPAGHPVDPFLNVLLSDEAMSAHGPLVIEAAAEAAGIPPVGDVLARAGRDRSATAGQTVPLDGSKSLSFVEGAALSFDWFQIGEDTVALLGAHSATATFVAPDVDRETILSFRLRVSAAGAVDVDEVQVTVRPAEGDGGGDAVEGGGDGGGVGGDSSAGDVTRGQSAYADHGCAVCHGADAGGGIGPTLSGDRLEALRERFGGGATHGGATLDEQQIADVAAWLAGLAP